MIRSVRLTAALAPILMACVSPRGVVAQDATVPLLEKPFKVMAGGQPIAVIVGHAAPFVYDFNHDGKKDLIVGEYGSANKQSKHPGRARIYINTGTDAAPVFKDFTYLKAQEVHASVPSV
jgi:hypothetical protein